MYRLHLRPIGDTTQFSDLATYPVSSPFEAPSGMEWVSGEPPQGATIYIKPTLFSQLDDIFKSQPMALQMAFAGIKSLCKEYAQAEDWETVKTIIADAPIPPDLSAQADPVRQQLLGVLGNA